MDKPDGFTFSKEMVPVDYPDGLVKLLKKKDKTILKELKATHEDLSEAADNMVEKGNTTKEEAMETLAAKFGLIKYKDFYVGSVQFNFIPQKLKDIIDAEKN